MPTQHLLALNENPLPPLPSVVTEIARHVGEANRYPEFYPERLKTVVADWLGASSESVVVGSGSVGVALQALQAAVRPGGGLAYGWRNFDAYPLLAEMVSARAIEVPLLGGGQQDLEALAKGAADADAVIVCNPHNPTGQLLRPAELEEFVSLVPARTLVILDEAYIEFVDAHERPDSAAWVQRFPNLLVLRTFSKAYGLAGLRVGYGLANPALARRISAFQLPYAISPLAMVAVEASLGEQQELDERVRYIVRERERLAAELLGTGWNVLPSRTNFLWFDEPGRTGEIREALERADVVARYYDGEGVRLTVGDTRANDTVLEALS